MDRSLNHSTLIQQQESLSFEKSPQNNTYQEITVDYGESQLMIIHSNHWHAQHLRPIVVVSMVP
jgi:hypothetical protein